MDPYAEPDKRPIPRSPESPPQATPPPSPPTSQLEAPRIRTLYFGQSVGSFLEGPESPEMFEPLEPPPRSRQRITKDSDTLRDTMLGSHLYTPPESSKKVPEVVVNPTTQADEESESQSVDESKTSDSESSSSSTDADDDDDDKGLYILQPRIYTPVPPAATPSPRASVVQREPVTQRGTPDELSIHIEAEEELPQPPNDVRETVLTVPRRDPRRASKLDMQPKPLQIPAQAPQQRQSRSSDKEVVLGHKTSLRDRVSLKEKLPTAIHVPPMIDYEIKRPRYPTPQASPRGQRPPGSSHGFQMDRRPERTRTLTTNLEFSPPNFPSLIPSPASERQHFRPVQASPHSPLQQRPHTAGTVVNRSGPHHHHHHRHAPSQMGMSTLSTVATMRRGSDEAASGMMAGSTRTVKKKRSAFGWLKKAFSLDEEERAAFEARKNAQPLNYYQQYQASGGHSPRYLDGKRIA